VYRIFGEKFFELLSELSRESFIMRDDESWSLCSRDDIGHGKRLPRSGHPEKGLILMARVDRLHEFSDGVTLVSGRGVGGVELEDI
jgi:hypothetical protein